MPRVASSTPRAGSPAVPRAEMLLHVVLGALVTLG